MNCATVGDSSVCFVLFCLFIYLLKGIFVILEVQLSSLKFSLPEEEASEEETVVNAGFELNLEGWCN